VNTTPDAVRHETSRWKRPVYFIRSSRVSHHPNG
jgi:hypothetical protein